jgi:hypothetical protein
LEVRAAAIQFLCCRTVLGRRTPGRRCDVATGQRQAIVTGPGGRPIGPPIPVERLVEPDAAGISSEDPARPVASVSTGCKTDDEQPGLRVTEPRHGAPPVRLGCELPLPHVRDLAAVAAQPGAELTPGYSVGQLLQRVGHDLVGKAEQKPLSAAAGGGLDLREDRQVLPSARGARGRNQPPHFDFDPLLLQGPRARPATGPDAGALSSYSHPSVQETVGFENLPNVDQGCLVGANWNAVTTGQTSRPLEAGTRFWWTATVRTRCRLGHRGGSSGVVSGFTPRATAGRYQERKSAEEGGPYERGEDKNARAP